MAAIDDLIIQIEDKALRQRLRAEADRIIKRKKFGLVFEQHLPELTPIYNANTRRGSVVVKRGGELSDLWRVLSVAGGKAHCLNRASGEKCEFLVSELLEIRQFGDPIFPVLVPVNRVQNGAEDAVWHTLIEADNYHALQLLEYLYAGQVDCIYIDPPYNTGARDWKYNNDYVDSNDRWRHSKWLAMMRRRLLLAFSLLKPDGIMVITIDDNEIHHLRMLLEDAAFGQMVELGIVCIRNNPGGRATANGFSVNHEYAIFVGKTTMAKAGRMERTSEQIARYDQVDEKGPFEWANFRKHGAGSRREDRKKQYYPIYVSSKGIRIPDMTWNDENKMWENISPPESQERAVWPVRIENGKKTERVWSWGEKRVRNNLSEFMTKTAQDGTLQIYKKERVPIHEGKLPATWWDNKLYSSNEYGTKWFTKIFGAENVEFQYPKSPYAVADTLKAAGVGDRKNALIVDFFAGSGTTLESVNLLNVADNGTRRCILVTNNEVSGDEANSLVQLGHSPGKPEWEDHGICRSVTWPRCKYTILGTRDDDSELEGEYLTGNIIDNAKQRKFQQIGFTSIDNLSTITKKKQLVALIKTIPQSEVNNDSPFIVSEKYTTSILFDDSQFDCWLEVLEEQEHISDFYIVTSKKAFFEEMKGRIIDSLGPLIIKEEEKRPMRAGFPVNLEYFRMDFLDKDYVALGRQFREILPLLWLRAGAVGPRPKLPRNKPVPAMMLPDKTSFAVLIDEARFADFLKQLKEKKVTHVYLVTDSEEAFQEMAAQLSAPHIVQLYRDYLENFVINKRESME